MAERTTIYVLFIEREIKKYLEVFQDIDDGINEGVERAQNVDEEFERDNNFEFDHLNLTTPIREGSHRSGDTLVTLATNASQVT